MVLSGWKEIAGYLHCGVRTVQRWEAEGLPIYRPAPGKRSHVVAHSDDLDHWVRRRNAAPESHRGVLTTIQHSARLQQETRARILQLQEHVIKLQEKLTGLQAWRQRQFMVGMTSGFVNQQSAT